jgi:PEGA domain
VCTCANNKVDSLRERDLQHDDALLTRRAQLIAAAEALVVWVHDRRATWANDPLPAVEPYATSPSTARSRPEPAMASPSAYTREPVPVFERPPAPSPLPPDDEPPAPYERPPAYQPPPAYEPRQPEYDPPAPSYEPARYEPPPAEEPPPTPAYETPSRHDIPMPAAPAPYQPFSPAAVAAPPPAPSYEPPAVDYPPPAPYIEPRTHPVEAPPPPPPPAPIRVEPPTIAVQEYVPPARVETAPPPVERPATREQPRQSATEVIAPVARWGMRLGVAAAIITGLLVGAARVRPYLTSLSPPTLGTIVIESAPTGSDVTIDGKPSGQTPFSTEVTAGRHVLEFKRKNLTRTVEVEVAGGKMTTSRLDWGAKPVGKLTVESDPTGAKVTIDGKLRGATPLTVTDMSVGSHTVVIEGEKGSVRRTVDVTSERETTLSETIFSGFLKVFAPFELTVSEAGRPLRLDERTQLMLAPGIHELRFENKQLGFYGTRKVEIEPGKTATVTLTPGGSTLSVSASAPAEVFVDGQRVGDTPLVDYPLSLGTRDIVVKGAAGERRFTQTVTTKPLRIEVDFSKP